MLLQVNSARNRCLINPTSETIVEKGDQLIMMRPTCIASHAYKPLKQPVKVDRGKQLSTSTRGLSCTQNLLSANPLLPNSCLVHADLNSQ